MEKAEALIWKMFYEYVPGLMQYVTVLAQKFQNCRQILNEPVQQVLKPRIS